MKGISIGTLEKNVQRLAEKIAEQYKCEVEIETFKSGHYSNSEPSYVRITIETEDNYVYCKFLANGYGSTDSYEFGGWTFSEMKYSALEYIKEELN
tara:strand:+ start:34 stop:321 length:288 start_codon:yes stop_codon:yes gene_type:complete